MVRIHLSLFVTFLEFLLLTHNAVLIEGPYLVRGASISDNKLAVTGDIVNATTLDVFAPKAVTSITWNGKTVKTHRTEYGSLKGQLSAPKAVTLPKFGSWKSKDSLPERSTDYDDSGPAWVGMLESLSLDSMSDTKTIFYRCGS